MSKICTNSNCVRYNKPIFPDTASRCDECGMLLEEVGNAPEAGPSSPANAPSFTPKPVGIQQETRYQSDDITVAGNQINAQAVDNRTVTNITNLQDEGKTVVTCAISGEQLYRLDAMECPKCHRMVSKRLYDYEKLMCSQCAAKETARLKAIEQEKARQLEAQRRAEEERRQSEERIRKAEERARAAEEAMERNKKNQMEQRPSEKLPPVINQSRPQQQIEVTPIMPSGGGSAPWYEKYKTVLIGVAAIAIIGAGVAVFGSGSDEKTEAAAPVAVAGQAVTSETSEGNAAKDVAVAAKPKAVQTETAKKTTKTEKPAAEKPAKATIAEATAYDKGLKAYKAGEYSAASLFLKQALGQGDAKAGYYMAQMYKNGKGVTRNAREAFAYMKKAAEGGCADAYYELAEMYRKGDGTEANRSQAKKWYEQAVMSSGKNADKAAAALAKYN